MRLLSLQWHNEMQLYREGLPEMKLLVLRAAAVKLTPRLKVLPHLCAPNRDEPERVLSVA